MTTVPLAAWRVVAGPPGIEIGATQQKGASKKRQAYSCSSCQKTSEIRQKKQWVAVAFFGLVGARKSRQAAMRMNEPIIVPPRRSLTQRQRVKLFDLRKGICGICKIKIQVG